jgi:hypothetical protein
MEASANQDQRDRLLVGTERLQSSSRRLEDARRIAMETGMEKDSPSIFNRVLWLTSCL